MPAPYVHLDSQRLPEGLQERLVDPENREAPEGRPQPSVSSGLRSIASRRMSRHSSRTTRRDFGDMLGRENTPGTCGKAFLHEFLLWIVAICCKCWPILAMPNYRITFRDGGEPILGVEVHPNMTRAHRSAVRTAVAILMDTRPLDGVSQASVEVRDEKTDVVWDVLVSVVVNSTVRRGDDGGSA